MEYKMRTAFNSHLGKLGTTTFLNYEMLQRNEVLLASDPIMQELKTEVETLVELKKEMDMVFERRARIIAEKAGSRIKELTNEKYV